MPVVAIAAGVVGLMMGAGGTFVVTETSKQLTTIAVVGGLAYLLAKKQGLI